MLILLTLFYNSSGLQMASTWHVATGNQGVSCSQQMRSGGLPLNQMECETSEGAVTPPGRRLVAQPAAPGQRVAQIYVFLVQYVYGTDGICIDTRTTPLAGGTLPRDGQVDGGAAG